MRNKLLFSLLVLPLGFIILSGVAQAKSTSSNKIASYGRGVHQGVSGKEVSYSSKLSKLTPEQRQQIQQAMDKLKLDKQKLMQDKKDYKKNPSDALKQAIVTDQATIKQDKADLKSLKKQFGLI